jgi:serine/threonine-protein kinase
MQELVRQLGDYRLACFQAQEAFIDLYQGEHVRTGAAFSLAVFHTRVEGDAAARFEREAQRLVRLNHPNLIRIHDFNRAGNLAFLVQDVPSQSLRQLYPPGAQLPAPLVATYVRQIGEALQYAHEQGMVHGELRPEHLLLQPDRRSLLVSNLGVAGIAQAIASSGARRPARSPYLAPEQAWGPAQPASDQYALAALVYEWLSGEPLALSVGAANAATLHPLRSLAQKAPTLPAQAIQILQTALSQEPAQRFGSVQAFVNAFEQACATHREPPLAPQNQPILVPTPMGSTPPAGAPPILVPTPMGGNPPAPSPMPSLAQAPVDLRRRGLLIGLIAGGAGLALAGTGAAFFIKARLDASTQQPTQAYTHERSRGSMGDRQSGEPDPLEYRGNGAFG